METEEIDLSPLIYILILIAVYLLSI